MSPVRLQCLTRACWAYPQFTTSVLSSTVRAWLSSRQYVTDSSLKPPLDLGILSNLAKTLSECCQSAIRVLSQRCQSAVRVLSECCQSAVRVLSQRCHNAVRVLSECCHNAVTTLSQRCQSAVTTLSQRCHNAVRALPGSHPHQVMYRQVVLSVSSQVILGASSNRLRGTPLPFSSPITVLSSLFHLVPFVIMSSHHHRCLPPNAFKSPFKPLLKLRAFLLLVQRSFRSL